MADKKPQAPAEETPKARFTRLAQARTGKALDAIAMVGRLTGPAYASTPEQLEKIVAALTAGVQAVKDAFDGKKGGFTL